MRESPRSLAWNVARRAAGRLHATLAFSQEGEDLVLGRLLERQPTGFYVDVGAFDPVRFSNTYLLYLRGWHGIAIDPTPGFAKRFTAVRRRDVALESAVVDRAPSEARTVELFRFDEPALNTLSAARHRDLVYATDYRLRAQVEVPWVRLDEVLADHDVQRIDLLSVDTETTDLDVLRSNDWARWRPRFVCCEDLHGAGEVGPYLEGHGYVAVARTMCSVIFTTREELDVMRSHV